ncbi:acyl-CoA dehydrogenase family protein [Streptomyces sp. NPDC005820]|uniref:acyl-CoA dehydrogenase family protein n=1 Tax=Streptomyces sp. NPDC005820 TaxID=3157069 RepID=UPI0033CB250C
MAARPMALAHALNTALRDALVDDDRVLLLGQDIGRLGGVFRVTDGLQDEFGPLRVVDTPLGEAGIVGSAIGLAMAGYRPVCEIQFDGFVFPAMDQIVTQLAKYRHRTEGAVGLPVVIRIPVGGGIGAIEHHSESPEAYFAHTAGLRVVAPGATVPAHRLMPTQESADLIRLVRDITADVLLPRAADDETTGRFPREVFATLGKAGLLGLPFPEAVGGGGQPYEVFLQVLEELSSARASVAVRVSVHTLSCTPLHHAGTAEQVAQ